MNDSQLILGVDIGGTGIKAAVVDTRKGTLTTEVARIKTPQPATPKSVVGALAELTKKLKWHGPVGVGFPRLIKHGIVRRAPNLDPSWVRHEIVDYMRRVLGVSFVAVGNDAMRPVWLRRASARDAACAAPSCWFTLGTGIGSAVLHNGSLLPDTELGQFGNQRRRRGEICFERRARTQQVVVGRLGQERGSLSHQARVTCSRPTLHHRRRRERGPGKFFRYLDSAEMQNRSGDDGQRCRHRRRGGSSPCLVSRH